ncbi:dihydrolipoamide acetyltransferase family protein [Plasticicumulans acidivorans]|uniref:Dihydrolipoamide acetyltransferase component of pyruvate dehydrogenase complex n=1 Tax=Plasticicumulans acidivorans TaxID=886464 RepID=A0A317N4S7_9GAMM|nr:dihydrolipoamide acetyltransferase family protein [Plasticicumulans acidivorans]PWV65759.1 pyruvate dehydrogenase E2 component (dihydrolipoamide acetyltransferase) [Plasticicumulans acidivorans]
MTPRTFALPDLGEGLTEAEIVAWHVKVGDEVHADQPLLSVETAKAIVEVPAPRAGRVAALFGEVGDIVHVHDTLVEFTNGDSDSGTVVGVLASAASAQAGAPSPARAHAAAAQVRATPAVRALAARLGVALSDVTPSGHDGTLSSADVERAAALASRAGPLEPLRGPRRAMAQNMARAHAQVVPVSLLDEVDIDAWPAASDVTLRLLRALAAGIAAEPALNAWFDSHAGGRRLLKQIDVGIAVDTPECLFVPVMHDVGQRNPASLRAGLEALKSAVCRRSIPVEELRGATITLSNFGMIAGRHATPIVLPPTVAILGAGRIRPQPVALGTTIVVHRVLPLSLSFDHRAVTGGEAGRFLAAVMADLQRAQ